jgi:hypothetical protein
MRRLVTAIAMLALAAGATACRTAQAKAPATRPALEVPPPPPRLIEPLPSEPVATLEPVADLPPPPPTTSRPRTVNREAAARETAKPEPKPEPPPPTTTEPAAPATNPPANPQPQIRTPGDNSESARQVREILDRAAKGLEKVDYLKLTPQRKESYDTAKRFIVEAEEALKASNIVYARFLADKAETLARELQGR